MPVAGGDLLRGISLAASLTIAVVFWWPQPRRLLALCGSLLTAAAIAFTLLPYAPAASLRPVLLVLAMTAPFWFWAVIQLLFEDRQRLPRTAWIAPAALVALTAATQLVPADIKMLPAVAVRLVGAALVAHAGWCVLQGRRNDLVAGRLKLRTRLFVVLCVAVAGFVVLAVLLPLATGTKANGLLTTALMAAFQLAACYLVLTPNLALTNLAQAERPEPAGPSPETQRLISFMIHEQPWKNPDLTIAALAAKLALPEYRLRRLINETLGHRNFSAFLNTYRLAAAAEALDADPKLAILTIALDNGFGSIGPFNRAFRERYGMTPTAWRRRAA
jgi:AraC-like DNA-binding protein